MPPAPFAVVEGAVNVATSDIENAKIISTRLGYEDHGTFACRVVLAMGLREQAFGDYPLDDCGSTGMIGTVYGCQFLMDLLSTVGVDRWEGLCGTYVRVDRFNGDIRRLGHIIEDRWFDPRALAERLAKAV